MVTEARETGTLIGSDKVEGTAVFGTTCPSSDNLRLIRLFAKGGSG